MRKPKKTLSTKLANEEAIEEVLVAGDENAHKGNKAVVELEKEKIHDELEEIADQIVVAKEKRRFSDPSYLGQLRTITLEYMASCDASEFKGWRLQVLVTDGSPIALEGKAFATQKGLLAILVSPTGQHYVKGMLASFDPELDTYAARGLGIKIEDTVDYYNQPLKDNPNKIWTS